MFNKLLNFSSLICVLALVCQGLGRGGFVALVVVRDLNFPAVCWKDYSAGHSLGGSSRALTITL